MGEIRIGVDLGGTQIKTGIVEEGTLIEEIILDTPLLVGYEAVLDKIEEGIVPFLKRYPKTQKIGMGVPGLIDTAQGIVCYSNNFGWENVSFVKDMQERLSRNVQHNIEVIIANDAQCAALGEALYGAGAGYDRVAMFTIGTGVGGGFVKNGQLETDRYGAMAYIFGHMTIDRKGRMCNCGRQGCLEAHASATALAGRGQGLYEKAPSAKRIFEGARKKEHRAGCIVEEFMDYLSIGTVNIANILRPGVIVIGGGVSASSDMILPKLEQELKKGVYGYSYAPVKVVCAKLENKAGIVGAASL